MVELQQQASDASLWDDPAHGQQVTSRLARLTSEVDRYDALQRRLGDATAIDELLSGSADTDLQHELEQTLAALEIDLEKVELAALLSGPYDAHDAIATVQAGAGGTESMDWADMLLRMYTRWAEQESFKVEVDEVHYGDEAGIKSATFTVHGPNAYGLLSAERGVHRLVRISPFDAQKRRHTSFASLDVIPALDEAEAEEVEVDEADLRIDVYRSSGPGGQGVNTTDSAVRITHLPTGIVVACQNERSQLQNRATAMSVLQAKLLERRRQEEQARMDALKGDSSGSWGNQMRSYVLHPYQMVKDLRTEHETGNTAAVLDGEIDDFIESGIRWRKLQESGHT